MYEGEWSAVAAEIKQSVCEETERRSALRVIDQAAISNLLYSCKLSALEVGLPTHTRVSRGFTLLIRQSSTLSV